MVNVVDTVTTQLVIIEGTDRSGTRFTIPVHLQYDSNRQTTEEALLECFNCRAQNFEELAVREGWFNAYWTYPMAGAIV